MPNCPDLVLGIDASTTAVKAIAWDASGNAIAEGRAALSLSRPRPAWHEQPADEWWQALCQAVQVALQGIQPERIAALCIAHQRETFVIVDEAGQPLRPAIVWMDERARPLLPELEAQYGAEHFHRITGKPLSGNLLPGKLAWLRQHEPESFRRMHKVLDVHAFLVHRLTGEYRTSAASADPMGLFDMQARDWAQEILQPLGVSEEYMPQAFPPGAVLGEVTPRAAELTGLPAGLKVVAGLGDGQAGGLGVNITHPGEAYLNLGTAVVSGTLSSVYRTARQYRTHYGGVPGAYSLETVILGGAYTTRWFAEQFAGQIAPLLAQPGRVPEESLDEVAQDIPPGGLGLLLVPYWNSVLNPYWDAGASGIVVGWRGVHQPAHLYRAILEGIAFEQRLATEGVEQSTGQPVECFIAFGGGARSALWRQIIADVTGKPVYRAHAPEATALGAGILAATTAEFYPSAAQAAQAMTHLLPGCAELNPQNYAIYDRLYQEVYRHLYPALQPLLSRLTQLTESQDSA